MWRFPAVLVVAGALFASAFAAAANIAVAPSNVGDGTGTVNGYHVTSVAWSFSDLTGFYNGGPTYTTATATVTFDNTSGWNAPTFVAANYNGSNSNPVACSVSSNVATCSFPGVDWGKLNALTQLALIASN